MLEKIKEWFWGSKMGNYVMDKLEGYGDDILNMSLPTIADPYEQSIIYGPIQRSTTHVLVDFLLQCGYKNDLIEIMDGNNDYLINLQHLHEEQFSIETLVKEDKLRRIKLSSKGMDLRIQIYSRENGMIQFTNYSIEKLSNEQTEQLQKFYANLTRRCIDIITQSETKTKHVDVKTLEEVLK